MLMDFLCIYLSGWRNGREQTPYRARSRHQPEAMAAEHEALGPHVRRPRGHATSALGPNVSRAIRDVRRSGGAMAISQYEHIYTTIASRAPVHAGLGTGTFLFAHQPNIPKE